MSDNSRWVLCNSESQFCSVEMDISAARKLLSEVRKGELDHWSAWQPSWPEWKSVTQCPQLLAKEPQKTATAKNPLASRVVYIPQPVDILAEPFEKRRFPRFEMRLRVVLRTEELSLRTYSQNISKGGIYLEHPIPERIFGSYCRVFIEGAQGGPSLRFKLSANSKKDLNFFSFAYLDVESLHKLERWMNFHVPRISFKVS